MCISSTYHNNEWTPLPSGAPWICVVHRRWPCWSYRAQRRAYTVLTLKIVYSCQGFFWAFLHNFIRQRSFLSQVINIFTTIDISLNPVSDYNVLSRSGRAKFSTSWKSCKYQNSFCKFYHVKNFIVKKTNVHTTTKKVIPSVQESNKKKREKIEQCNIIHDEENDRRCSSLLVRTSKVTGRLWYFSRSLASERETPAESFGSQIMGGGAISSGAYSMPAMSFAWSVNPNGGRCGGASGCVRAARSVAVKSSKVSVSELDKININNTHTLQTLRHTKGDNACKVEWRRRDG